MRFWTSLRRIYMDLSSPVYWIYSSEETSGKCFCRKWSKKGLVIEVNLHKIAVWRILSRFQAITIPLITRQVLTKFTNSSQNGPKKRKCTSPGLDLRIFKELSSKKRSIYALTSKKLCRNSEINTQQLFQSSAVFENCNFSLRKSKKNKQVQGNYSIIFIISVGLLSNIVSQNIFSPSNHTPPNVFRLTDRVSW